MLYLQFLPSTLTYQLLRQVEAAGEELDLFAAMPQEYTGELRRQAFAQSVHFSTRIEGNTLSQLQVECLLAGEHVAAPRDQVQEVKNCREAIEYVQSLVMHGRPPITEETIKTIHFLITKSLPGDYIPGQYRASQNCVVDRLSGRRLFFAPDAERVPELMREFVQWLNAQGGLHSVYRAALAHLNFVAIHPFIDGNGRTARVLETLVMYVSGYRAQVLVSLEAYFGRDRQAYYQSLSSALGPRFAPEAADVTPWVDYSLQAHVQ